MAQPINIPQRILIRGFEPHWGQSQMEANRGQIGLNLSNGPAKLISNILKQIIKQPKISSG